MAYYSNNAERSLAITRVIMIYAILLFCSLVPVYYLLSIPNIASLNVGNSEKNENRQESKVLEEFKQKMAELDVLLESNSYNADYQSNVVDLNQLVRHKIDTTSIYYPVLKKFVKLYEKISDVNNNSSYKGQSEKLMQDNAKLEASKESLTKQLEDCNKSKTQ